MIQKRYDEAEAVASGRKLYPYKKIPFALLARTEFRTAEPTTFAIDLEGETFEFLINHQPESKKAVILGTGAVALDAPKPNFKRCSWANELPCSGIWYADPTIYDTELILGWGYGRNDRWYLRDIAFLLRIILAKLGINERDTLFFGSSGGGTTASFLAAMFGSKATVINPQVNVLQYWPSHVNRLREVARERDGSALLDERLDLLLFLQKEQNRHTKRPAEWLHLIINEQSQEDAERQLKPFMQGIKDLGWDDSFVKLDLYSAEGGHNAMPSKEDCLCWIREDIGMTDIKTAPIAPILSPFPISSLKEKI